MKSILIFYPDKLKMDTIGLLQGVIVGSDGDLVFYVTSPDVSAVAANETVGYCSENTPKTAIGGGDKPEWLHVNVTTKEFTVHNVGQSEYDTNNPICIAYDYERFRRCDRNTFRSMRYGTRLDALREMVSGGGVERDRASFGYLFVAFVVKFLSYALRIFDKMGYITRYSTTLLHFEQSLSTLRSVLLETTADERISIKSTNTFLSKLIDFVCGYLLLYMFFKHESVIFECLNMMIEVIIENLRKLLVFLMGSPIGLKLNYAFNTTLGSFFFYHIFLWKTFVQFIRPHLYSVFYMLMVPASFGISYQAAVVEDLIKFCTIHVYCIYVYAARLYGLQIYAIVALWRLFIGRKYNPLRNRVDSYQYNHNQLFIGTLTFTILLFLLPTTLLYYVVFTTFRLFLKTLNYALSSVRVLLQHLPVYSVLLWTLQSSKVAGSIVLSLVQTESYEQSVHLHLKLEMLPLMTCIRSTLPDTAFTVPKITLKNGLSKVFAGKLL